MSVNGKLAKVIALFLLVCLWTSLGEDRNFECRRNCSYPEINVDLTYIQGMWDSIDFDGELLYLISLCGDLVDTKGCKNVSVCGNSTRDDRFVLGVPSKCSMVYRGANKDIQFSFNYSQQSPYVEGTVDVRLICGKTLGYPNVVNSLPQKQDQGHALIEWVTRAACPGSSPDAPVEENKCYALEWGFDSIKGFQKEIFDLNPLISASGYKVDNRAYKNVNMVVNPCRPLSGCGSVACREIGGKNRSVANFSSTPTVTFTNNQLQLHYPLTNDLLANCSGSKDQGFVFYFNCPLGDIDTVPILSFADERNHCFHTIAWNTDHACGLTKITNDGGTSCTLKMEDKGIFFNLTTDPLVQQAGNVSVSFDGGSFHFAICKSTGLPKDVCPEHGGAVSVAQRLTEGDRCFSAGGDQQVLRYADDELVLTISNGDPCSNGLRRRTVITFICSKDDPENRTQITYTGEDHCLYTFEWVSPAACVSQESTIVSDCQFTHGNHEYDFGELLSKEKNWVASVYGDQAKTTACVQISPCGNLITGSHGNGADYCSNRHVPVGCANASVCMVTTDGKGKPLGQFIPGNDKHIRAWVGSVLTMETQNGPPCNGSTYSTVVDYVCRPGKVDSLPQFVGREENCTYKIEWQTAYACLNTVTSGGDCHVVDPKTSINFDLNPLKSDSHYSFNTSDHKYEYQINFCGPALGTPCSNGSQATIGMCQIVPGGSPPYNLAGSSNTTVQYDGGVLRSMYVGGSKCHNGDIRTTTVNFECDPDALKPNIVDINEVSHCQYVATVQTVHACPVDFRAMACTFQDKNHFFDLTPLVKTGTSNWIVTTKDKYYIINICRPLNLPSGGCKASSTTCKYTSSNGAAGRFERILGTSDSGKFWMNPKEQLVLGYTAEGTCKVNITFICDKSVQVMNGPTFESELNCAHHFTWRTPYACTNATQPDQVEVELDSSCIVQDPLTKDIYNYTLLRKSKDVNITTDSGDSYYINICARLNDVTVCDGKNATVCQVTGGNTHVAGTIDSGDNKLTRYSDGTALLVYDGGEECHQNKQPRRSEILFICPKDKTSFIESDSIPVFVNESSHCVYNFHWETRLACVPKRIQCSVGTKYNLEPLAKGNVAVSTARATEIQRSRLVMSLCGPVNISADPKLLKCPFGAAACLMFENGSALSLGEVESGFNILPKFSDGLQLLYTGGDKCIGGKSSHMMITLICARGGAESTPILSPPDWKQCSFHVRWETKYACSIAPSVDSCKTRDPLSGAIFSIGEMLGKKAVYTASSDQYKYTLNVCGKDDIHCGGRNDTGIVGCQTKLEDGSSPVITGLLAHSSVYNQGWGDWLVTFQGGDKCQHSSQRTTYVHIICNESFKKKDPVLEYLEEDQCEYYFRLSVYNETVCHSIRPAEACTLEGYNLLPLSTLGNIAAAGIWEDGKHMYFSICQPLNLSSNSLFGCGAHSLACLHDNSGKSTVSYTLSTPVQVVDTDAVKGLEFVYTSPDKSSRVTVTVQCKLSEEFGSAIVTDISGDNFTILIPSVYGCDLNTTNLLSPSREDICNITNPLNHQLYNFSSMLDSTEQSLSASDQSTYFFDLCGGVPRNCSGSSMCKVPSGGAAIPIAGRKHHFAIAQDGAVEVIYEDGKSCGSGKYTSVTVTLVCSEKGGSPRLLSDPTECVVEIFWPTPLLCQEATECVTTDGDTGKYYDLTPLSATPVWSGTEQGGAGRVWLGVCRNLNPIEAEAHKCPPITGVCFETAYKTSISLGQLSGPPTVQNGSHVSLSYTNGGNCSNTTKYSATVNIRCSQEETEPLIHSVDNCSYVIEMSSPDACELDSKTKQSDLNASHCVFKLAEYSEMNFTPLSKPQVTSTRDNKTFTVSVCDKVVYDGKTYTFNGSESHAWRDSAVMVYSGKTYKVQVHVHFECDASDSSDEGHLVYQGMSNNIYVLHWTTRFACSSVRRECQVHSESSDTLFDLTPLYHNWGYEVTSGSDRYYINICGSLSSSKASKCASDSSVCLVKGDKAVDLASASSQELTMSADHEKILLSYNVRSSSCVGKGQVQIIFNCAAIYQRPKLLSHHDDCTYVFTMDTPSACEVTSSKPVSCHCTDEKCPEKETDNSYVFILPDISKQLYSFTYGDGHTLATLKVCAACAKGKQSAICLGSQSAPTTLPSYSKSSVIVQGKLLSVTMNSTDNKKSVNVVLECRPQSLTAKLEFIHGPSTPNEEGVMHLQGYTSKCYHTALTNAPATTLTPPPFSAATDSSKVGVAIVAVLIVMAVILGGCLFLVLKEKRRRYILKGAFMRIFTDKSNEPVKYTRLRTNDSDDDQALLLEEDNQEDSDKEGESKTPKEDTKKQEAVDSGSDEELLDL